MSRSLAGIATTHVHAFAFQSSRRSIPAITSNAKLVLSRSRMSLSSAPSFSFSSSTSSSPPSSSSSLRRVAQSSPCRFVGTNVGAPLRKKVTTVDLQRLRDRRSFISMVTAYSYPSAVHVEQAGIDVLLVGDSLAMVELGHDTTLPVSVDDMLHHCKAVAKGATTPLLVGDLPFGSYEADLRTAYVNAIRYLKEGEMDCVKLEGGKARAHTVKHLVDGGVAVMGHIGLTPQHISILGGFRVQGKTLAASRSLIEDALALQRAGAFSLVVECVPAPVARAITAAVRIPTIGIGSGPHCSGQVLVYHDLLGFYPHAHHAKVVTSFCKQYAKVGDVIQAALNEYKKEVGEGTFPGEKYSPFKMTESDISAEEVERELDKMVMQAQKQETANTVAFTNNPLASSRSPSSSSSSSSASSADEPVKVY